MSTNSNIPYQSSVNINKLSRGSLVGMYRFQYLQERLMSRIRKRSMIHRQIEVDKLKFSELLIEERYTHSNVLTAMFTQREREHTHPPFDDSESPATLVTH